MIANKSTAGELYEEIRALWKKNLQNKSCINI